MCIYVRYANCVDIIAYRWLFILQTLRQNTEFYVNAERYRVIICLLLGVSI